MRVVASMKKITFAAAVLIYVPLLAISAEALDHRMTPIATPPQPTAIPLNTGTLPNAPVAEMVMTSPAIRVLAFMIKAPFVEGFSCSTIRTCL